MKPGDLYVTYCLLVWTPEHDWWSGVDLELPEVAVVLKMRLRSIDCLIDGQIKSFSYGEFNRFFNRA